MVTVIARQHDTVDAICWRALGATRGVVEAVYALNRGLAACGPFLPVGMVIVLPERASVTPAVLTLLQLWD